MRCTTFLLVLLGVIAVASATQPAAEVDYDAALVEVDADAELGYELEAELEADEELDLDAEVDAEAEVDVDADADEEADVDADEEGEADADADAEAEESFLEVEAEPASAYKVSPYPDLTAGMIILPVGGMGKAQPTKEDAYRQLIVTSGVEPKVTGWALRKKNTPAPVNITDVYTGIYDKLQTGCANPVNITENLKIRHYTYVLVPGFGASTADYFVPVMDALKSFGVHHSQILVTSHKPEDSTVDRATTVYKTIQSAYEKFHNQRVIVLAHGGGFVASHAALALYPDTLSMLHGMVALNGIYGGSVLGDSKNLPENLALSLGKLGFNAVAAGDLSHKTRQEFIAKYPIDYNQLRLLSVASHSELEGSDFDAAIKFVTKSTDEINDGVTTISDQLIPGARAIILDKADHNDLVVASGSTSPFNATRAAQAWVYSFFKTTP